MANPKSCLETKCSRRINRISKYISSKQLEKFQFAKPENRYWLIWKEHHHGRIKNDYGGIRCIWLGLISVPAQQWLVGKADKDTLVSAINQADKECGSCGCNLDPLYKRALELLWQHYQFNLPSENCISTTKMPLHGQNPDSGISGFLEANPYRCRIFS